MSSAIPFPAPLTAEAEETTWMRAIAAGDEAAMRQLFQRWQRPVLAFLHRMVGSAATAEDLALEVFVRLHRAAPGYEPRARFSTYVFGIAHRLALNELRRRRRKPADPAPPEALDYLTDSPAEEKRMTELEEVFQRASERLAPKQRTALLLIVQQELSYEEAATVLGSNPNAVRVLVHRARQELRNYMEDET